MLIVLSESCKAKMTHMTGGDPVLTNVVIKHISICHAMPWLQPDCEFGFGLGLKYK